MDAVDKIGMALTPGTVFNQQNKIFRSAKALGQFANVDQGEVLDLIAENLAGRVTIRPSAKRPENGPLIALTEFVPDQVEDAVQVKVFGGSAVYIGGKVYKITEEDILEENNEDSDFLHGRAGENPEPHLKEDDGPGGIDIIAAAGIQAALDGPVADELDDEEGEF